MISTGEKNHSIDVFEYVLPRTRVFLEPRFRQMLFKRCIEKFGTNRIFSKLIGVSETTARGWRIGKKNPPLWAILKIIEILKLDKELIHRNTLWITNYFPEGKISIKNWRLVLNSDLSEWLGLLVGDGSVTIDYVSIHNNNLDVIFFFKRILEKVFGIIPSQMETIIRYSSGITKNMEIKQVKKLLKSKGISRIKLDANSGGFKRSKPNVVLRVSSRAFSQLIRNLIKELTELLKPSNKEVKSGYVRGFSAAEGSVYNSRGFRAVSINQKGTEKLQLIKSLLNDIGVVHVSNPKLLRKGFYHIVITTRRELENFRNLVGFGSHKSKNKKLDEILAMYRKDIPYLTPKKIRYQDILKVLKTKSRTCLSISGKLKIKPRYVNKLLNEMLDKRMISVDRSSRTYVYFPYYGVGKVKSKKCFSLPSNKRFKQILNILHGKRELTTKQIASEIGLSYSGTIKVIRKMLGKNLLKFRWRMRIPFYRVNKNLPKN